MKLIQHNKPFFDEKEVKAVQKVLESGWVIHHDEVAKFETSIKKLIGRKYAIGVTSGHAALHVSLLMLGVGAGDEVIIPSYTPQDIANTIFYTGAKPVIVDIEKNGFNIDPERVKEKITKKTKAIIVPHLFGYPAKIDEIKKFGIKVIEDCAQVIGTSYKGKPLGTYGDLAIFSFYASKIVTTGQGGMILTDSRKIEKDIRDIIECNGRDKYRIRYNYPMTDLAACIGNVQLKKLKSFLARRKKIANQYRSILDKKEVAYWPKKEDVNINHFRFILKFSSKTKRDAFRKSMVARGISTIIPLYNYEILHVLFKLDKKQFPNAEEMSQITASIPIFPALTDAEVSRIVKALDEVL